MSTLNNDFLFEDAVKSQALLRMCLIGLSGGGKTYSALRIAGGFGADKKIGLIDTESGSALKYAKEFPFRWKAAQLRDYHPDSYVHAIRKAEQAGLDILIIDSVSHAWSRALELVDEEAIRLQGNKFGSWAKVTPIWNRFLTAMVSCKMHLIVTMRAKTEYVVEENERGKKIPRKVGLAPIFRDGGEYEFDIVGDMDVDNNLIITKSRYNNLTRRVINRPSEELGMELANWLSDGSPVQEEAATIEPTKIVPSVLDEWMLLIDECSQPEEFDRILKELHEKFAHDKGQLSVLKRCLLSRVQEVDVFYDQQSKCFAHLGGPPAKAARRRTP